MQAILTDKNTLQDISLKLAANNLDDAKTEVRHWIINHCNLSTDNFFVDYKFKFSKELHQMCNIKN